MLEGGFLLSSAGAGAVRSGTPKKNVRQPLKVDRVLRKAQSF